MNVFANYAHAGALGRTGENVRFSYQREAGPEQTVSLTMPLNETPYLAPPGEIHPIFDMNLPEGALHEAIRRMFLKVLPEIDKLTMLQITGRSQIGRLRVAGSVEEIKAVPERPLHDLLASAGTEDMFDDLLENYARYSGIAGAQPKVLARDNGSLASTAGYFSPSTAPPTASADKTPERVTATGTTHIVKMFDSAQYPALATNEFLCLQAAKKAGLPVPAVWLAENRRCLVVERFDTKPDGGYLAFEDCCALDRRTSVEKYNGTYEQTAKLIAQTVAGVPIVGALRIFFESLVLSCAVRNGDAHRKNFGVLYDTPGQVRLAPIYDIITTTPYLPNDTWALLMDGSKRWPSRKKLMRFGVNSCLLTLRQARESIDKTVDAVRATLPELDTHMADASSGDTEREFLEKIRHAWNTGIASLAV